LGAETNTALRDLKEENAPNASRAPFITAGTFAGTKAADKSYARSFLNATRAGTLFPISGIELLRRKRFKTQSRRTLNAKERRMYGYGRAYKVNIEAEDGHGNKIKFIEIADYPDRSRSLCGCVHESEREAKAIEQVRERMPHLKNVRARGSIHV
jgi:hypothetical protein